MAEDIIGFDDYAIHMAKKMRLLRHHERCIFSAWCAEHLLESHARLVEETFSKAGLRTLREVLGVIWEILLDGSIPNTDVLNQLDMQFMQIEADAPLSADPVAIGVRNAIGLCILSCRRNNVGLAVQAGEDVIRILDFTEREPNYADNSPSQLFRHPVLKKVLEAQLAMIRHLRGEYPLGGGLRSIFRD